MHKNPRYRHPQVLSDSDSNRSYRTVLFRGAVNYAVQDGSNF